MYQLLTEFCENRLDSFCVILLTNKLSNADENITFLAEINITMWGLITLHFHTRSQVIDERPLYHHYHYWSDFRSVLKCSIIGSSYLHFDFDNGDRRRLDKIFKRGFRLNLRKYVFGNSVMDNCNSFSADCVKL